MRYWFGYRVVESRTGSMPGIWQPEGPYDSHEIAMSKSREAREPDMEISDVFSADTPAEAIRHLQRKS